MPLAFADHPQGADFITFGAGFGRRFLVTVDTEEEFAWDSPLQREGHSVDSVPKMLKFQQFCAGHGVKPVFLVDYPVISNPAAAELLREFVTTGVAGVGVHLHPWVNPPHEEDVTQYNSFAGNLPYELERRKLLTLRDAIGESTGAVPVMYRAGRYGVGPNTPAILHEAGIKIDSSVRAKFDYSGGGGPDFKTHPLRPYWLDKQAGLAELPLTSAFWGVLRQHGDFLYPRIAGWPLLRGALARTAMLERIALTPEGISIDEAIKAIDIALDDGLELLNFSFHSPSLRSGYTPYVRDGAALDRFYDWWRRVFAYLAMRKVAPVSLDEMVTAVAASQ